MKNTINKKGITLIALVVTIIILLILAGVTVGLATNGTGLFEKAKLATEEYNNKAQQEETELLKASNEIDNYTIGSNRDYFNLVSFSYDEQDTGLTWIDGKHIFQKSYYYEGALTTGNTALFDLPPDIDYVIDLYGAALRTGTTYIHLPYCDNGPSCLFYMAHINTGKISLYRSNFGTESISKYSATIIYTKNNT